MNEKNPIRKRDWGKEFVEAWTAGLEGILNAANIYVEAINEDPANAEKIQKAASGIVAPSIFRKLEAIGKGVLDPRVLPGVRHKGKITKLPFDLQKKVLDGEKFKFLTSDGTHLMITLLNCEDWQAQQMFANDHIRTLKEQKVWVEGQKIQAHVEQAEHEIPLEKSKKGVLFRKAMTFLTWKEIVDLGQQRP